MTKVLVKRLARVMRELIGEAQTCVNTGRTAHDNLHLIRFSEWLDKTPGKGELLVHLDKFNDLDWGDNLYLTAVLEAAGLGSNFYR